MPSIVIILGMHRSGTSAVANLISSLGFDAGDNLRIGDEENQKGYWEDNDIIRLNNEILSYLFVSWDEYEEMLNRKIYIFIDNILQVFKDKAIRIINKKLDRSKKIIIKDPRFNILIPFWDIVFDELNLNKYYILVTRNPLSVSKSLSKRNNLEQPNTLLLWYYYNLSVLNDLTGEICIVPIEDLAVNPEKELHIIHQFLKLDNITLDHILTIWKEIFDKKIIHASFSIDDIWENTRFCPDLFVFYKFLSDNSDEPFPIQTNKDFITQNFNIGNLSNSKNKIAPGNLYSSVFYENKNEGIRAKFIQKKHGSGNQIILFDFNENDKYNEINIFLCDKPCIIRVDKSKMRTDSEEIILNNFDGNYLFKSNNIYIFDSNNPNIRFILAKPEFIFQIELTLYVEVNKTIVSSYLIPYYRFSYENQLKTIQVQEIKINELTVHLQTKEEHELNQIKLFDENNSLNAQLIEYNNIASDLNSKLNIFQKENNDLRNSLNALKNSYSWKITFPIRFIGKYLIFILTPVAKLLKDIGYGFSLLRREGIERFIYRAYWYIKGKRLLEDINDLKKIFNVSATKFNNPQLKFPKIKKPLVSIIIPVFNQWDYTYNCLKSIFEETNDVNYEIIIADDASTDETINLTEIIKNVRHIRNKKNLQFLSNCNNAAKYAKGKYIHFLNNDVIVHPDWLSTLLKVIENDTKIGLVGSKIIYPDGKLQEAGGIIWSNASGCNYGILDDPDKPEYNYLKETDYISGASILIRKKIWKQLRGFDKQFSPAYYEDTDLSFRIRKAGFKVIYQPLSVITHYEGISHGRDEKSGIKQFQLVNKEKFLKKWEHVLYNDHVKNKENIFVARDRSLNKKCILVIDHYVPQFDCDAGSRSTFNYLKLFVSMGFNVKFIGDSYQKVEPYTSILLQMGIEVLYGDYYKKNIEQWFEINGRHLDIVIANRSHIAPKYLDLLIKYTNAKIAYIGHDLQFIDSKRKYEMTGDIKHHENSIRFKERELSIFSKVDVIMPFSTFEAPIIKELAPDKIIQTIPVYFFQNNSSKINSFEKRNDIMFVGGFAHPPNTDSICWFVKEVFPTLQNKIEGIKLFIIGSHPKEIVKQLASDSIIVTGYITDDQLKEYYSTCRVAILPLQYGAGVKGKLLEALYYQIPTVITSVAAEGVPEVENHSIIANEPQDFAKKIELLYLNKKTWKKYSKLGKSLINKYYTEKIAEKIITDTFLTI